MTFTSPRNPTANLPPLSHAHQEGLRLLVGQLRANGQDVRLLEQLAESMPRLRAGLSAAERQRIEALDASELALSQAHAALQQAINQFDDTQDALQPATLLSTVLVDPELLHQIAEEARSIAEAANELALRAAERAGMLSA